MRPWQIISEWWECDLMRWESRSCIQTNSIIDTNQNVCRNDNKLPPLFICLFFKTKKDFFTFLSLFTCLFLAFTCRFAIHTVLDIANFFQLLSALSRYKDFLRGLNQSKTELGFSKGIWLIFPKKHKISLILYCRIKKLKTKRVLPYQTRSILIFQSKEGKVVVAWFPQY